MQRSFSHYVEGTKFLDEQRSHVDASTICLLKE